LGEDIPIIGSLFCVAASSKLSLKQPTIKVWLL